MLASKNVLLMISIIILFAKHHVKAPLVLGYSF